MHLVKQDYFKPELMFENCKHYPEKEAIRRNGLINPT